MDTLGKEKEVQSKKVEEFSYPDTVELLPKIHPDTRIEAEKKLPPFSRIEHKVERFNGSKWVQYDSLKFFLDSDEIVKRNNLTLELNRDIVNMKNDKWLVKRLSKEGFNMSPNTSKKNPALRMVKPGKDDVVLFIQGE